MGILAALVIGAILDATIGAVIIPVNRA